MAYQRVRSTCEASLSYSNIKINNDGIKDFWRTIDIDYFNKFAKQHGIKFPLNFASPSEELNVLAVLSLLNFLHAYRVFLHAVSGRGAYDTIRYFIMAAFTETDQGASPLTAKGMSALTESTTAELLGVPIINETPHDSLPGVTVGQRMPEAVEVVGLVQGVLNETGAILQKKGFQTLGDFVEDALQQAAGETPEKRGDRLVQALVETFPAFDDAGSVKGHEVCVFKKALFFVHSIASTFEEGPRQAPTFPLPSSSTIPVFCDNILCMMSLYYKFLDLSETPFEKLKIIDASATSAVKTEAARLDKEDAYALRAAVVTACEKAIDHARSVSAEVQASDAKRADALQTVTAVDLDGFLWSVAKDGKLREIPRIAERGTVFY